MSKPPAKERDGDLPLSGKAAAFASLTALVDLLDLSETPALTSLPTTAPMFGTDEAGKSVSVSDSVVNAAPVLTANVKYERGVDSSLSALTSKLFSADLIDAAMGANASAGSNSTSSVLGKHLVFIGRNHEAEMRCLAAVGTNKFCYSQECKIAKHQETTKSSVPSGLYIKAKGPRSLCLLAPSIQDPFDVMDDDAVFTLLEVEKPSSQIEWQQQFEILKAENADHTTKSDVDEAQVTFKQMSEFKTPKKNSVAQILDEGVVELSVEELAKIVEKLPLDVEVVMTKTGTLSVMIGDVPKYKNMGSVVHEIVDL